MLILFSAALFAFGVLLFGLGLTVGLLGAAICVALKLLIWTLQAILWALDRYTEPQTDNIVITINFVDDDEEPPMRDVTPPRARQLQG